MKELFTSYIKEKHAEELHCLIKDLDDEVFYLDFDKITVLDVGFFRKLKKLSGENYAKIKYVNLPKTFRAYI